MKRRGITGRDGVGTLKPKRLGSMVTPCWMEKVWSWARHVFIKMVLKIIGSILIMILVSSTCVTVHISHGPSMADDGPSSGLFTIAALSKNLQKISIEA